MKASKKQNSQATVQIEKKDDKPRVDRKGNIIDLGNKKKYKISFTDTPDKQVPLSQVNWVESYKKYNTDQSQNDTPCCSIF